MIKIIKKYFKRWLYQWTDREVADTAISQSMILKTYYHLECGLFQHHLNLVKNAKARVPLQTVWLRICILTNADLTNADLEVSYTPQTLESHWVRRQALLRKKALLGKLTSQSSVRGGTLLSHFTETPTGLWEKLQDLDGLVFQGGILPPQLPSDKQMWGPVWFQEINDPC